MICEHWGICIDECLQSGKPDNCLNHPKHSEKCILSCDKRPRITCRDRGKTFTILNTVGNNAINYRMDGGIIKSDKTVPEGIRKCDNAVILDGDKRVAVLVELKGEQISSGISQLYETYNRYREVFAVFSRIYARCVTNRRIPPNLKATPEYRKLMIAIGKKGNYKNVHVGGVEADIDFDKIL